MITFIGKVISIYRNDEYTFTLENSVARKSFHTDHPANMKVLDFTSIGNKLGVMFDPNKTMIHSVWEES